MRLSPIGISLVVTLAFLVSCERDTNTFTSRRKLQKISLLNGALVRCVDLPSLDSIRVCAASVNGQTLQGEEVSGVALRIWETYAQANALAKHHRREALALIEKTLPETEDYNLLFERAQFLNLRSFINTNIFNRQLAVYDAYQAADIYMELGLQNAAAVCYLNIANVQYNAGNHQISIENALLAVDLYAKSPSLSRIDSLAWLNAYNTLGMAFSQQEDYISAAEHLSNGLNLADKMHHELWAGIIMGNAAKIDISRNAYDSAWAKYSENIRVGLKYKELASAGSALMGQGEILMSQGNLTSSKLYYDSAWQLLQQEHRPELWILYFKNISNWYETVKDYAAANASYKKYIALRDSTQGVQSTQLLRLQNQIQFEKQLSLLRLENNLKKNELKTSYVVIISFFVVVFLLSLLLYILRRNFKNTNKLNDALEHKVRERTDELRRLNKELDTYLYRASHDVRRPILSIIGLGRLVGLAHDDNERREIQRQIDLTAHQMDRMLAKIRMAYELDKFEDEQEVNIKIYLSALIEKFRSSYPEVTIDLAVSDEVSCYTSVGTLDVLFFNILENACIFRNPVDPKVSVVVSSANDSLKFVVKDNGIGIDPKYLKTIFNAYTRYSYKSVGSGLGLHLVKKAVRKLNGTIAVDSTLYVGSEFRIEIPHTAVVDAIARRSTQQTLVSQ